MEIDEAMINTVKDRRFEVLKKEQEFHGDDNGEIILGPQRFNIMGSEYFMAEILSSLSEIYGEGAGGIIRKTGVTYGDDLLDVLDTDQEPQQIIGDLLGLLKFLGYSNVHLDDGEIIVPSSPTAAAYMKHHDEQRKTCYFLSGILTAAIGLLDEDGRVEETACLADGDDQCRFELPADQDK